LNIFDFSNQLGIGEIKIGTPSQALEKPFKKRTKINPISCTVWTINIPKTFLSLYGKN